MIQFRIQGTPNPRARKYIVNTELKTTGKVTYKDSNECAHVPLGLALFKIPGITQIHFFENVLTATQNGSYDWVNVDQWVQDTLIQYLDYHDPDFDDGIPNKERPKLSAELAHIDKIIDEMIRPSLQLDGGDVELLELDGNVLTLRYMGACGGCPSAMTGTLQAIESIVQAEIDPKIQVVAI